MQFIDTKANVRQTLLTLTDFGDPVHALWFTCCQVIQNYMAVLCTKLDIYGFVLSTWHIEHVDEFPNSFTFMFYRRFFFVYIVFLPLLWRILK